MTGDAGIVVEMGNHVIGHDETFMLPAGTGDCPAPLADRRA